MNHQARKRFGQNFLKDQWVIEQIIRAIDPKPSENFVEIGPGLGALTTPMLERIDKLSVIEIDRDLTAALRAQNNPKLHIIEFDALKFNFASIHEISCNRSARQLMRIIGNLPYNISTPLLFHLLRFKHLINDMFFMLQKELVDRICADAKQKPYGRLSVILQAYCHVEPVLDVPPEAFQPAPTVNSAVIKIQPKINAQIPQSLELVVKTAFSKRRKTLLNNLKALAEPSILQHAPIDLSARAESLEVAQFIDLALFFDAQ